MAAISKVIRLAQNLRGAEPPMLTLCIDIVGRIDSRKSIAKYIMPLYTPFWRPFSKKGRPFFKVIRVIFENMRFNRHTRVYVSFFGNIIQIAYCYVHHTMEGTIWLAVVAICSICGNLF